ncbi:hypothetical protein LCGC14_3118170 [marine sediment metagenome]|uniref:Uncharacterized protein n=1 Tax=marine sediment metagenome TaxID=412755 RepID=A0A0F8W311_9ZZZZ
MKKSHNMRKKISEADPERLNGYIDMFEHRTHFLESTPQGRLAKKQQQPDGEDIRLLFLNTLDTAKQIVTRNLQRDEDEDDFESLEF